MARKPVYGNHRGSARTTVNGKRDYLRAFISPESKAAFDEIMADWEAAHLERRPTVDVALTVSRLNTAVRNACDKAGIPCWSPGQLRKTRATQARRDGDLETAQQISRVAILSEELQNGVLNFRIGIHGWKANGYRYRHVLAISDRL